ncbi:MAG: putative toxin-antitoxin system toxin component, PIN family [Methylococcales bacterium]
MRIVLDTNVLIAAFIARGGCNELLEHCSRTHELITSQFILDEFTENLTGKFKFTIEESNAAINLLRTKMLVVEPVKLNSRVSRDKDDDNIIATAVAGNCDCIITGDNDLLVLRNFSAITIIKPADFPKFEAA